MEKLTSQYAGFVVNSTEDLQVWKVIVFDLVGHQPHEDIINILWIHL